MEGPDFSQDMDGLAELAGQDADQEGMALELEQNHQSMES